MDAEEILDGKITEMQESLKEANQTLGALHVLVRLALAEADAANATDAVKTLNIADNLVLRGHINGGVGRGDVVFGRD